MTSNRIEWLALNCQLYGVCVHKQWTISNCIYCLPKWNREWSMWMAKRNSGNKTWITQRIIYQNIEYWTSNSNESCFSLNFDSAKWIHLQYAICNNRCLLKLKMIFWKDVQTEISYHLNEQVIDTIQCIYWYLCLLITDEGNSGRITWETWFRINEFLESASPWKLHQF